MEWVVDLVVGGSAVPSLANHHDHWLGGCGISEGDVQP